MSYKSKTHGPICGNIGPIKLSIYLRRHESRREGRGEVYSESTGHELRSKLFRKIWKFLGSVVREKEVREHYSYLFTLSTNPSSTTRMPWSCYISLSNMKV